VTKPLILWLLGDGKPGHENQSLGLADALGRQWPCEVHRISLAGKRGLFGRLRAAVASSAGFPRPDLVIGAGHATHAALLGLARKHRAQSVVLMKPSLPLGWFDRCIAPEHDFPAGSGRKNVILTRGALNRVTPAGGEKSGKLILVGGPSKTHGWDGPALLDRLAVATDRGGWELSDSRRTPNGFLELARTRLAGVEVISHHDTPPEWVPEKLQQAKEVWVTEDSVSMIYEALTSGARVGLLPVPRKPGKSRVLNGIDCLVTDGFLTPFDRWQENHRIANAPETLREADRCAEELIRQIRG
jgi:mitochondrial fission protein ELM1